MKAPVTPWFAHRDVAPLLHEELACVPDYAARQPAGRMLLIQASAENRTLDFDGRHLDLVRMHVQGGALAGDASATADALPWENDAFQLVVAQHVGDVLRGTRLVNELARVLAPGGLVLWFGLNPWSPWLVWLRRRRQSRGDRSPLHTAYADPARRALLRQHLAATHINYLGPCWPHGELRPRIQSNALLAPLRSAYLISATKPRIALTPLRTWRQPERIAMPPRLAASRRARA